MPCSARLNVTTASEPGGCRPAGIPRPLERPVARHRQRPGRGGADHVVQRPAQRRRSKRVWRLPPRRNPTTARAAGRSPPPASRPRRRGSCRAAPGSTSPQQASPTAAVPQESHDRSSGRPLAAASVQAAAARIMPCSARLNVAASYGLATRSVRPCSSQCRCDSTSAWPDVQRIGRSSQRCVSNSASATGNSRHGSGKQEDQDRAGLQVAERAGLHEYRIHPGQRTVVIRTALGERNTRCGPRQPRQMAGHWTAPRTA